MEKGFGSKTGALGLTAAGAVGAGFLLALNRLENTEGLGCRVGCGAGFAIVGVGIGVGLGWGFGGETGISTCGCGLDGGGLVRGCGKGFGSKTGFWGCDGGVGLGGTGEVDFFPPPNSFDIAPGLGCSSMVCPFTSTVFFLSGFPNILRPSYKCQYLCKACSPEVP